MLYDPNQIVRPPSGKPSYAASPVIDADVVSRSGDGSGVTVRSTKLYRSELATNDVIRTFNTPRPFLLLPRVPVLRHYDAFVTNFTEAEFLALYFKYVVFELEGAGFDFDHRLID
ncbi:hypothetical protein EVAR_27452_1 [Eumeta japonica]|uniref:Uncharacterized protein n=1 Tax=Eumeta variegata TaxID=151549 RepID=A0A4C1VL12_EUMVA|nr:hypothetical protein EVAR_27452_1 [Eumeta japonica]